MPRFKLRTLLIVLTLGPPVIATAWWALSTARWETKVTDTELAFAMVATFVLTYLAACLLVGLLLAGVVCAINWLITKIRGH